MEDMMTLLDNHMYVVVVTVICLAIVTNAVIRAVTAVLTTQSRELSRREIAAYIAEGSITPEQGERLVKADVNSEARRRA